MTTCKAPGCGKEFLPFRPMAQVCSVKCAQRLVKTKKAEEKQKLKARKEKAKPRSTRLKEAQQAFNAWIRLRDAKQPCISCGRFHGGQIHAGHFLSTGARPELRFHWANVHAQCAPCNTHLSGNLVLYRASLINRVGLAMVEWLEGPHESKKYTIADLRQIKETYRAKAKELESKE